jgi:uncharacterized protein
MRIRGYAPGAPCWADVASPDVATTAAFYRELFGWVLDGRVFRLRNEIVAGVVPLAAHHPPAWLPYIATDDAAAIAQAVVAAGGQVRVPPQPVGDLGHAAVFGDREGATFAAWQRGTRFGAHLSMEPGALCWFELATRDVAGASTFYRAVFGWDVVNAAANPGDDPYYEWHQHGDTVGGMVPLDHRFPADIPAHWTTCFMVGDCANACDRVAELGGRVARKPMAVAGGWYARVADPTGAHFALIELADELRSGLS